jgi:hypothetical protein
MKVLDRGKFLGGKWNAALIAVVLMSALAVSLLASVQIVEAVDRVTYTYLAASPNPVGVGQEIQVNVWTQLLPPSGAGFVTIAPWHFTVTITDPNGQTQTLKLTSDPIGGQWFKYTPAVVGTYTLKAEMAQENVTIGDTTTIYLASTSNEVSLVVQEEPIAQWPSSPLPSEFWSRPIDAQNRDWYKIGGNWVGMPAINFPMWTSNYNANGKVNPYTTAPGSAHILWTYPVAFGGLVGGQYGSLGYYTGDSYELKCYPQIIMNGIFYRNLPVVNDATGNGFVAIDLYTGEELWRAAGTIGFGQLLDYESINQHGVIPYLWSEGATQMYDAWSGKALLNFADLPYAPFFVSMIQDERGNLLVYILDAVTDRLVLWNSTQAILYGAPAGGPGGFGYGDPNYWRPNYSGTYNGTAGIMWNVTIPDLGVMQSINRIDQEDGVIIARAAVGVSATNPLAYVVEAGYSMTDGHMLWNQTRTGKDALVESDAAFSTQSGGGVYVAYKQETRQWYGYDVTTGQQIWVTDPIKNNWAVYTTTIGDGPAYIAYGKLYATAYDGTLHCYDIKNGNNLWNGYVGSSGFETPYGTWPLWGSFVVADGKVYVGTGEHSPNQPIYRGETLNCFDAETGDRLWNITGWMMNPIIADGYLVAFNSYDMQNYCFGKGPSAVTVSASPKASVQGNKVVIEGMVTDKSAGVEKYAQTARFPNGVPAIADKDMTKWMQYLYMDQPLPTDAAGVEVSIDVLDSNGNYRNIGTTTSDLNGFYTFTWEPDITGDFKAVATFAGSESYYASYSETSFTVIEPQVTPAPTPTPASMTDTYVLGIGATAIIAIIAAAIVIVLMLRKR